MCNEKIDDNSRPSQPNEKGAVLVRESVVPLVAKMFITKLTETRFKDGFMVIRIESSEGP